MNLRKTFYFLIDFFFRQGTIKKHLSDIRNHYYEYESEENIIQRNDRLKAILSYAKNNVPYYKDCKAISIEDFPVVNKSIIKSDYSQFISNKFEIGKLTYVTTSGSTGTPFKSYRDSIKIKRHQADNIFFNSLAGASIGDRLYYFRVWNSINKKGYISKMLQNIVEVDANDFSNSYVAEILNKINIDKGKKYLLSYASSYEAFVNTIHKLNTPNIKSPISCIISMSETLPEGTRNFLDNYFKTVVISRYSNMENGFIAQQCIENKYEYHINSGSFLVEILDLNEDKRIQEGHLGRIVITDYYNHAMPLIRYDTGDLGIMNVSNCSNRGPVLSKVEGRRTDFIFSTTDTLLSPHIITNTMWKYADISQFQFIQKTAKNYILKINSNGNINQIDLQRDFMNFLGDDAIIDIQFVDEIPLLASGKRKKVVNEYKSL